MNLGSRGFQKYRYCYLVMLKQFESPVSYVIHAVGSHAKHINLRATLLLRPRSL